MSKLIAGVALAALSLAPSVFAAEKTETLQVAGWHCRGCARRTESALKEIKGVSAVSADKAKKQVTVTYDDAAVKREDLEKAVADSGFSVAK